MYINKYLIFNKNINFIQTILLSFINKIKYD